jgi:hypothetical protein
LLWLASDIRRSTVAGTAVHYEDRILPVTAYGTYPVPDPAEDEKTIDLRLDAIVAARSGALAPVVPHGRG